ncbi:MAG: potassium channel family protein [Elusimicrobiaceae bacterium]|jgi:voltage-gated potassium channel|nr:potassium channel family protein [Elusimicrobiaceae bacterium]MBT3955433.1 potassium channel family protein [Elusimicrobiaceae bacterium]MBT4008765.1 potassium channel family protein [Elusimicrobiaceae bacterium]MBT4402289.1 potassium channel family protein [Elusimicrobiaceae bacterium]MBT4440097.1 potassium channel family protein [Elusimicrobiaceae bacterium]
MPFRHHTRDTDINLFEIIVLFLSLYSVIAIAMIMFLELPDKVELLITRIDFLVCLVFLSEFTYNMIRVEKKWSYFLRSGWIDLVSSIPVIEYLRYGRIFRIFRLARFFNIMRYILKERSHLVTASAFLVLIFVLIFASIGMLLVETAGDSNIQTPIDALWWAFITITTVGYGDHFPVTIQGRMIAVFMAIIGISFFSVLTAYITSYFRYNSEHDIREMKADLKDIKYLVEKQKKTSTKK